ncbi:Glycine cleavage system H protein [Streptomyces sp. enrichment culture]|uniref:glycine cleavage system protein GcvH n=1 Tax=Streptomyces sp. enrichment culture TaxID=1795815 RepID=UPI003F54609A
MANFPDHLFHSKDHEWLQSLGGGTARIGITDHAQRQLGDIVFAELPTVGSSFQAGEAMGSLESVKAVTEVYLPLSGTVTARNDSLEDDPERINQEPYGDGWLIEIALGSKDFAPSADGLLSAAEYAEYLREEADG